MQALFEEHMPWAESIAHKVHRGLPPSFDIDDLEQIARIQHWRCVEAYDPSRNDNYRAFAYFPIRGAVLMSCRRRNYREATHEELPEEKPNRRGGRQHPVTSDVPCEKRPGPEEVLLRREQWRNVGGPREYRQRVKLRVALALLPAEDADLVRNVYFAGADVGGLEQITPGTKKRLTRAVHRLKRELKRPPQPQPQRKTDPPARCESAAAGRPLEDDRESCTGTTSGRRFPEGWPQLPPEELRAAITGLPPADAYLIRRVHLDGADGSGASPRLVVWMWGSGCARRWNG